MSESATYPLDEALKALAALRNAAGLPPEQFPLPAFVGMISDEVDSCRQRGLSDQQITDIISQNSAIRITPHQLAENYASPEERHPHGD